MTVAATEPTKTPANTTAIATTAPKQVAKKPIDTFRDLLDKLKPQLAMALPKHVDVGRMIRICVTTLQRNPALLSCTQESVLGCLFQCAQLGLEPDGLLGHAYLIPFNDTKNNRKLCTLVVGYKGLLKLARQSNEIQSISARVVYSKDEFDYEFGLEDKLIHKPTHDEDPGEMSFAYAIFRYKGGGYHFDVMSKVEIDGIRARSKSGKDGPWVTDYDEMAKKTVLRRASKMAPASIEDLARAIAIDSRSEAGIAPSLDIDMPTVQAADVPGVEQQGQRLSLGKKGEAIDVPPEEAASASSAAAVKPAAAKGADPGAAISQGPGKAVAAQPATTVAHDPNTGEVAPEFVMSTSKQRKDIAHALTEAGMGLHEVTEKYNVPSFNELSHSQAEEALAWVRGIKSAAAEPGSAG